MPKSTNPYNLNERQKAFSELYVTGGEFFGNGVQTYIEVYQPDQAKKGWYTQACVSASQILSNIKVCNYINDLLEEQGLNDQFVDKQLLFLLSQHSDFKTKMSAIKEYNNLKARIIKKTDITSDNKPIQAIFTNDPILLGVKKSNEEE